MMIFPAQNPAGFQFSLDISINVSITAMGITHFCFSVIFLHFHIIIIIQWPVGLSIALPVITKCFQKKYFQDLKKGILRVENKYIHNKGEYL